MFHLLVKHLGLLGKHEQKKYFTSKETTILIKTNEKDPYTYTVNDLKPPCLSYTPCSHNLSLS